MADQCIVCLEDLDPLLPVTIPSDHLAPDGPALATLDHEHLDMDHPRQTATLLDIAMIKPCDHLLHDHCLREWSQKANSCPICRQTFNVVDVLNSVGGAVVSSYEVENKKQVADFDVNAWIEEDEYDEEEPTPCLVCGDADREDVLLLCDGCDVPYHTYCIGLDRIPRGHWFCMECTDEGAYELAAETAHEHSQIYSGRTNPRTLGTVRRTRQRLRTDRWYGAWGEFSGRVHDQIGLDLDFADEDGPLASWRRHQRRTAEEQREFQQWQQRLNIAGRQGARHIFRAAAPPRVSERAAQTSNPETPEVLRAWGAFERAQQTLPSVSGSRKRKANSLTASPADRGEPSKEPERKLKRPRTRRVPEASQASSSRVVPSSFRHQPSSHLASPIISPASEGLGEPTFLSSLLREVERGSSNGGSPVPTAATERRYTNGASSAGSPSSRYSSLSPPLSPSSRYDSPKPAAYRASLSITPPLPQNTSRSGFPLSSSAVTPPPTRAVHQERSDLIMPIDEICHPQPRKAVKIPPASEDALRAVTEAKHGINKIVKSALSPHWQAAKITKEQYSDINRHVSRKLYELISDPNLSDEEEKHAWQKVAVAEVATAVKAAIL